jgi:hypothetical protein
MESMLIVSCCGACACRGERAAAEPRYRLRAIAAVLRDPATTEHDRTNAKALKMRLEQQLKQEAKPEERGQTLRFG